jgi:hypothetical protein
VGVATYSKVPTTWDRRARAADPTRNEDGGVGGGIVGDDLGPPPEGDPPGSRMGSEIFAKPSGSPETVEERSDGAAGQCYCFVDGDVGTELLLLYQGGHAVEARPHQRERLVGSHQALPTRE